MRRMSTYAQGQHRTYVGNARRVTMAEFQRRPGAIMAEVDAGRPVLLTTHGRKRAILLRVDPDGWMLLPPDFCVEVVP